MFKGIAIGIPKQTADETSASIAEPIFKAISGITPRKLTKEFSNKLS